MSVLGSASTIVVVPIEPLTQFEATTFVNSLRYPSTGSQSSETGSSQDVLPHLIVPWQIRNKYYTADVQFSIRTPATDRLLAGTGDFRGNEPAVVVLASSQEFPSLAVKTNVESLAARSPEFDVSLLVTVPPSLVSSRSSDPHSASGTTSVSFDNGLHANEEAWDDLALDNGFEWVPLGQTTTASFSDDSAERPGFVTEDHDDGLGRIRDALESHLWEGMVKVTKSATDQARPLGLTSEARSSRIEREPNSDGDDLDDLDDLGVPPLPSPRPFVPVKLEFPSTFLPSIPRNAVVAAPRKETSLATPSVPLDPAIASPPPDAFEDDFSDFVQAPSFSPSTNSFPNEFSTFVGASTSTHDLRNERSSPEGSINLNEARRAGEEEEADLDSLEDLFEQIRLARSEILAGTPRVGEETDRDGKTMLTRRRERAQDLLEQVLGTRGF